MKFLKSRLKSEAREKIKMPGKEQLVIFLLFGILLIVIAIPTDGGEKRREDPQEEADGPGGALSSKDTESSDSYVRQQEERLKEVLQKVEGVGEVEVMITLKSSMEKVVEKDESSQSQTVEESDSEGGSRKTQEVSRSPSTVYQEADGDRTPYVVKELEPQVEGVVVIAKGGGSPAVKQNIMEAVQALFSVEAHKIKIMKMEGSQ